MPDPITPALAAIAAGQVASEAADTVRPAGDRSGGTPGTSGLRVSSATMSALRSTSASPPPVDPDAPSRRQPKTPQQRLRELAIRECVSRGGGDEARCAMIFDSLQGDTEALRKYLRAAAVDGAGAACAAYVGEGDAGEAAGDVCERIAGAVFDWSWKTFIKNWGGPTYRKPWLSGELTRLARSFSELRAGEYFYRASDLSGIYINTRNNGERLGRDLPEGTLVVIRSEMKLTNGARIAIPLSKCVGYLNGRDPYNARTWDGTPTNTVDYQAIMDATGRSFQSLLDAGVIIMPGIYTVD